jgi:hypothetical protein
MRWWWLSDNVSIPYTLSLLLCVVPFCDVFVRLWSAVSDWLIRLLLENCLTAPAKKLPRASVLTESNSASALALVFQGNVGFICVLQQPIETTPLSRPNTVKTTDPVQTAKQSSAYTVRWSSEFDVPAPQFRSSKPWLTRKVVGCRQIECLR